MNNLCLSTGMGTQLLLIQRTFKAVSGWHRGCEVFSHNISPPVRGARVVKKEEDYDSQFRFYFKGPVGTHGCLGGGWHRTL
jgi:hypothetical protein